MSKSQKSKADIDLIQKFSQTDANKKSFPLTVDHIKSWSQKKFDTKLESAVLRRREKRREKEDADDENTAKNQTKLEAELGTITQTMDKNHKETTANANKHQEENLTNQNKILESNDNVLKTLKKLEKRYRDLDHKVSSGKASKQERDKLATLTKQLQDAKDQIKDLESVAKSLFDDDDGEPEEEEDGTLQYLYASKL